MKSVIQMEVEQCNRITVKSTEARNTFVVQAICYPN